jgi:hypothetical protein
MAQWRLKDDEGPPAELLDFDPDDWVLGARGKPARIKMALDRWHTARWEWVMEDPHKRTIDGLDAVDLVYEDELTPRTLAACLRSLPWGTGGTPKSDSS